MIDPQLLESFEKKANISPELRQELEEYINDFIKNPQFDELLITYFYASLINKKIMALQDEKPQMFLNNLFRSVEEMPFDFFGSQEEEEDDE
jgi:hypothetical protein